MDAMITALEKALVGFTCVSIQRNYLHNRNWLLISLLDCGTIIQKTTMREETIGTERIFLGSAKNAPFRRPYSTTSRMHPHWIMEVGSFLPSSDPTPPKPLVSHSPSSMKWIRAPSPSNGQTLYPQTAAKCHPDQLGSPTLLYPYTNPWSQEKQSFLSRRNWLIQGRLL